MSPKSSFSISNKDYKKFIPVFSLQITHNPRSLGSQAQRRPVSLLTPGLSHLCMCVQEVSKVDVGPGLPLSSHQGLHEQEGGSQDRSCCPQEADEAPRTSWQPHYRTLWGWRFRQHCVSLSRQRKVAGQHYNAASYPQCQTPPLPETPHHMVKVSS